MSEQELTIINQIRNAENPAKELERAIEIAREIISRRQSDEGRSLVRPQS